MTATRGPVPKRSEERRRRNKESQPEIVHAAGLVHVPEPDERWHPIAREWYLSLEASAQSRYYEPSDWAAARLVAESMTRTLDAGRISAQMLAVVWSAMGDLLTTEGARRRMRLEVQRRQEDAETTVAVMADYRAALSS